MKTSKPEIHVTYEILKLLRNNKLIHEICFDVLCISDNKGCET